VGDVIVPGQLFTYQERSRFLRRRSGAGQVLGSENGHDIVFVRIFDTSGDTLTPIIGFLPISTRAFAASRIEMVKRVPLPDDWEALRDEWRSEWRAGEAGVFSRPLREVTRDTLATVHDLREGGVIELAFPKRSASGEFDAIKAFVSAKVSRR
jgi:hypothetical protein